MIEPSTDFPQTMPEPTAAVGPDAIPEYGKLKAGSSSRIADWAHNLTIADALVAVAFAVAAVIRFANLGHLPLSTAEAANALASWQFGHAGATAGVVSSPAYFTLTNAAMLMFGSSDAIARLVPAILGTMTVALVWALPRNWRPAGIIAVAAFLAVSPLNVLSSRTAGGAAIAIFALMLLVVSGVNFRQGGKSKWAYGLGIALGLGFTSDPLFISGVIALVPATLWLMREESAEPNNNGTSLLRGSWRLIGLTFVITFVLLSTSFLLYLPGLGASFGIAADWFGAFGLPSLSLSDGGLAAPFITALRYEPALLILGVPALFWALSNYSRLAWLIAGWWALLAVLAIFQPAATGYALLFTLPAYLLIGLLARHLFLLPNDNVRVTLAVTAGLVLLGMLLLVSVARYTRLALWSSDQVAFLILAVVAFLAAGGLFVLAMSYSSIAARQGAFLGLAVLLLYFQWGNATALALAGANDPRERAVIDGTGYDVRNFAKVIGDVSRQITGADHDLEVISTVDSPILRWYLREFGQAQFGTTLPFLANPQAAITPIDVELQIGDEYLGTDFGLRTTQPDVATPFVLNDALKWLLFRESLAPIETERFILWVRSDLAGSRSQ